MRWQRDGDDEMNCPECQSLMVRSKALVISKAVDVRWICAEITKHASRKVLAVEFLDPLPEKSRQG